MTTSTVESVDGGSVAGPVRNLAARLRRTTPYRSRGAVLALALAAVALPFVASALSIAFGSVPYARTGDGALIQMAVSDAAHFRELLGTYSRCGWHDPGPAWFYLLVPVYVLFGATGASLAVSSLALQCVLLCLCLVVASWKRGRVAILGCAAVLCGLEWALPYVFTGVWNPYFLVLPTLLMTLLCARAAAGSWPAWTGAVLCATVAIQAHVGVTYFALGMTVASAVACYISNRRAARAAGERAQISRRRIAWGTAGIAATVAFWIPPLVEQASYSDGNISKLIAFAQHPATSSLCITPTSTDVTHSVSESIAVSAQGLAVLPLSHATAAKMLSGSASFGSVLLLLAYLAAAAGLARLAFRAGDRVLGWTGVLAALGLLAIVYTTVHTDGLIDYYFVLWYSVIPVTLLTGWITLLSRGGATRGATRGDRREDGRGILTRLTARPGFRWALTGVVALATAVSAIAAAPAEVDQADTGDYQQIAVDLGNAIVNQLPEHPAPGADRRVLIVIGAHGTWWIAPYLVLDLRHRGWEPQVTPDWEFMYGHGYVETAGVPAHVFTLDLSGTGPGTGVRPAGARLVGSSLFYAPEHQLALVYEQEFAAGSAPAWYSPSG